MAEQDYKTRIDETKAALAAYSDQAGMLKQLYDQAIKSADEAYAAGKQEIERQTLRSKNDAAVENKRAEKNLGQTLAARGLSFSGENAQNALDFALNLQNRFADIDADAADKQAALAQKNADEKFALRKEQLKSAADSAEKKTDLNLKLAGLQQAASLSATANGGSGGYGAWEEESEDPALGFAERIRRSAQNVKEERYLTPAISAANLAKQMVGTISDSGRISGEKQQNGMTALLDKINPGETLEPGYYRQLMLNLQSLGYTGDTAKKAEKKESTSLKEDASKSFFDNYNRYYRIYRLADYPEAEAAELATEKARMQQMRFLYDNTQNNDQFHDAAVNMGLSDWLTPFYEELYGGTGK